MVLAGRAGFSAPVLVTRIPILNPVFMKLLCTLYPNFVTD
jgi:hypothetical protein